jgi:hypothetical protein
MIYIPRKTSWVIIVDGKYKLSILNNNHVSTVGNRIKEGPKGRW